MIASTKLSLNPSSLPLENRALPPAGRDFNHLPAELVREGLLLPRDVPVDFLSYPYEWGFEQLKDAALLTLDAASRALRRGLALQRASSFNVQFIGTAPVLLHPLACAPAAAGPWPAYEEFCRHFLAPLLLMAHVSPTANQLLRFHTDGIPLHHASRALPFRTWLRPGSLLHLHTQAGSSASAAPFLGRRLPAAALINSLRRTITALRPMRRRPAALDAADPATHNTPAPNHLKESQDHFAAEASRGGRVNDLGASAGQFARSAP
ncbi:MAG: hypothetical protein HY821_25510, partial [Acidobacteria bacterium]|nr:hypothetical protein [Acidobacteriota bacterium]